MPFIGLQLSTTTNNIAGLLCLLCPFSDCGLFILLLLLCVCYDAVFFCSFFVIVLFFGVCNVFCSLFVSILCFFVCFCDVIFLFILFCSSCYCFIFFVCLQCYVLLIFFVRFYCFILFLCLRRRLSDFVSFIFLLFYFGACLWRSLFVHFLLCISVLSFIMRSCFIFYFFSSRSIIRNIHFLFSNNEYRMIH